MYRTYEISAFGTNKETIFKELKNYGEKELIGLYASIIYMEHDLRTITGMPAEDALKYALEDHGIRLGNSDIWKYSLRFDTNKLAALNAILTERVLKLKRIYPAADMSFSLYIGKIQGKAAIGLESIHERYFDFISKRPYVKGEAPQEITFFGPVSTLDETVSGIEFSPEEIPVSDFMNFTPVGYSDKKRRASMVILNDDVMASAKELNGWDEADKKTNPVEWIDARENIASRLIDNITWHDVVLERTGFDPNKIPDFKKSITRLSKPVMGILSNFLK